MTHPSVMVAHKPHKLIEGKFESSGCDDLVYSPVAIDYSKGLVKMPDGTLKPNKIGCWVKSLKYAQDFAKNYKCDIIGLLLAYNGCLLLTYATMFWGLRL